MNREQIISTWWWILRFRWCSEHVFMGFLFPLTHSFFLPRFQSNVLTSTIDRLQIIECAFIVRSTESLCFNDDAGYLDFSHFNLFETRASEWGRIDASARGLPSLWIYAFIFCWLLLDWKDEALARAWANRYHFSSEMRWFKFVFRAEKV